MSFSDCLLTFPGLAYLGYEKNGASRSLRPATYGQGAQTYKILAAGCN
jgi:hypothetical protein